MKGDFGRIEMVATAVAGYSATSEPSTSEWRPKFLMWPIAIGGKVYWMESVKWRYENGKRIWAGRDSEQIR